MCKWLKVYFIGTCMNEITMNNCKKKRVEKLNTGKMQPIFFKYEQCSKGPNAKHI